MTKNEKKRIKSTQKNKNKRKPKKKKTRGKENITQTHDVLACLYTVHI